MIPSSPTLHSQPPKSTTIPPSSLSRPNTAAIAPSSRNTPEASASGPRSALSNSAPHEPSPPNVSREQLSSLSSLSLPVRIQFRPRTSSPSYSKLKTKN